MSAKTILNKAKREKKNVEDELQKTQDAAKNSDKAEMKSLRIKESELREVLNEKHENVQQIESHMAGGGGGLEIPETKKKVRKEMTPEEKVALVERLRLGRERKKAEKANGSGEEDKPEEAKAKEKKPRKEMTPEEKVALVERLRLGRERKKAEKAAAELN